jgi:hypothetical protein
VRERAARAARELEPGETTDRKLFAALVRRIDALDRSSLPRQEPLSSACRRRRRDPRRVPFCHRRDTRPIARGEGEESCAPCRLPRPVVADRPHHSLRCPLRVPR